MPDSHHSNIRMKWQTCPCSRRGDWLRLNVALDVHCARGGGDPQVKVRVDIALVSARAVVHVGHYPAARFAESFLEGRRAPSEGLYIQWISFK